AYDASLILKYVVNPPNGPDSLNSIQRQVADVSGNGAIMAYDASLILQYVVGLIPKFPAGAAPSDPDAMVLQRVLALHKTSSAVFKVGSGSGRHGERLTIPLEVESMTGVVSLQAVLNFDSRVMKIVDIESGGIAIGKTFVWAKDNQSGELRIALASSSLLTSGGTLALIIFEIADDARGTESSAINVTQVLANESDMTNSAQSAVIEIIGKPTSYQLFENYPNPFNPSTTIQYQVPDDNSLVRLAVYNTLGQLVKILVDERKDAGTHVVQWNGTDERGALVGSGVYYYRMQAGNFAQSKKLMLLK
ncbi:MAG: T9SS type A sorting domain-containing protein, partial [Ignavibacteriales bacterium]|nr:T9SS type A sorting domain-containing protein [Ignavibacteriales bacterium]